METTLYQWVSLMLVPVTAVVSWWAARKVRHNNIIQRMQETIDMLVLKNAELVELVAELRENNLQLMQQVTEFRDDNQKLIHQVTELCDENARLKTSQQQLLIEFQSMHNKLNSGKRAVKLISKK